MILIVLARRHIMESVNVTAHHTAQKVKRSECGSTIPSFPRQPRCGVTLSDYTNHRHNHTTNGGCGLYPNIPSTTLVVGSPEEKETYLSRNIKYIGCGLCPIIPSTTYVVGSPATQKRKMQN